MRKIACLFLIVAFTLVTLTDQAFAQRNRITLIKDAEIEATIRGYSEPIFQAAGIRGSDVSIVLVNDRAINAFVAGGMNMFLNSGLILETDGPGELIGVIAHETGHIAGGHLVTTRSQMERASMEALLATVLGVAAAIGTGEAGAGLAVASGGQEIAKRRLLQFSRAQESSADAAALNYLDRNGWSARGMQRFLEGMLDQELLPTSQQDEFVRTHPLTRDRVNAVRSHVERSQHSDNAFPAEFQEQYDRMIAKMLAYLEPQRALRRYGDSDTSMAARYARTIASFRQGRTSDALTLTDGLLQDEPDNPYFHELRGQILFESGRVADAIDPYRRSVELKPDAPLLRQALAHALVESGDESVLDEAIEHLRDVTSHRDRSAFAHRLLATAYGRTGEDGRARLHLAEEALLQQDKTQALGQANRAMDLLPEGSAAWIRAQDVQNAAENLD